MLSGRAKRPMKALLEAEGRLRAAFDAGADYYTAQPDPARSDFTSGLR